jgi:hypothetical protein
MKMFQRIPLKPNIKAIADAVQELISQLKHAPSSSSKRKNQQNQNPPMICSRIITVLVLATSALANTWAGFETLPNGFYTGTTHANGSTTVQALDLDTISPAGAPLVFDMITTVDARSLASSTRVKRYDTSVCWSYELNHHGVDVGITQFRGFIRNVGGRWTIPRHDYVGYDNDGVCVYICGLSGQGRVFDESFVDEVTYWMDSNCGSYQAGWYYPPSNCNTLFGKCWSGISVCS